MQRGRLIGEVGHDQEAGAQVLGARNALEADDLCLNGPGIHGFHDGRRGRTGIGRFGIFTRKTHQVFPHVVESAIRRLGEQRPDSKLRLPGIVCQHAIGDTAGDGYAHRARGEVKGRQVFAGKGAILIQTEPEYGHDGAALGRHSDHQGRRHVVVLIRLNRQRGAVRAAHQDACH